MLSNPFSKKRIRTLLRDGQPQEVTLILDKSKTAQLARNLTPIHETVAGSAVMRPANAAKLREMHGLLDLLDNDDIDPVFIALHTVMSERGIRFKADAVTTLTRLERDNRDPNAS